MRPIFLKPWDDNVSLELFLALRAERIYDLIPSFPPESALQFCARHRPDGVGGDLVLSAHLDDAACSAIGLACVSAAAPDYCELAFMLSPHYWGKGLAKEMVALVLENIRHSLRQRLIVAKVDSRNAAALGVLHATGFKATERVATTLKFKPSVAVVLVRNV